MRYIARALKGEGVFRTLRLCLSLLCLSLLLCLSSYAQTTSAGTTIESGAEIIYDSHTVYSNLTTLEVYQMYGLGLSPVNSSATIETSQTYYFPHTAENIGNGSDQVTFSLTGTTAGWASQLIVDDNMNGTHEAGETTPVPQKVVISEDATYRFFLALTAPAAEGTGEATATITSEGNDGGGFFGANGIFYGGPDTVHSTDSAHAAFTALSELDITRVDADGKIILTWKGGNADIHSISGDYDHTFAASSIEAANVSSYFTVEATASDGSTKYYRVSLPGTKEGFAPETAMKFSISFPVDYKLVSVPESFTNEARSDLDVLIGTQLTGGSIPKDSDRLYSFQAGTWKQAYLNTSSGWSGTLYELTKDKAAWVYVLPAHSPKDVTFAGHVPLATSESIALDNGFSFVGSVWPLAVDLDASGLASALTAGDVPNNSDRVYSFQDGSWKQAYLKSGAGFVGTLTHLTPGRGYWIYKQGTASTWTYPRPY